MTFDYPGYDLVFVQQDQCKDHSAHLFTRIYKFHSPFTGYHYILRAEYHQEDVFAIKFYCKKDRGSDFKYSKIINKGDVGNIFITCAKVVPLLLREYPTASFGLIGARTLERSGRLEPYSNTQRFRVYKDIIARKFGSITFEHIIYPDISGYLLVNKKAPDLRGKQLAIERMFSHNYSDLPDIL